MKHTWRIVAGLVVVAALVGFTGADTDAGQADLADRLLQEALTKELVEQDSAAAIKLYQQVIATAGVSAATATRARERSAALQKQAAPTPPASANGAPAPRRVLDGEWTELYAMSADGRLVAGQRVVRIGTQELVVRDLSTGVPRVVAMGGGGPEISDDGTLVAYAGSKFTIAETESGTPRVVIETPGVRYRAADFAPDGRRVLVEVQRVNAEGVWSGPVEFAWVSVADQSVHSIRVFERWAAPVGHAAEPEVSPDGRWLAFVAAPAPDTQDRYVYVMDAEGQTIVSVVSASGQRAWPKWTPDGRHILFTEEHGSGAGVWSVAVENGRAAGPPRLLYGNIGGDSALLGITRAGVLHYRRNDVGSGRYAGTVSHVVPRTLESAEGSEKPPMRFRGFGAVWSPDGRRLAFLTDGGGVAVRNVETGEERSYGLPAVSVVDSRLVWNSDGSALIVLGVNDASSGRAENNEDLNLYRIDLVSGAVGSVMNVGTLGSRHAALSKDDRTLYTARRDEPGGPFTHILAIDVADGAKRRVTALPVNTFTDPELAVSPDDTTLAIGAIDGKTLNSDGRVFTVNVDGTDFRDAGGGAILGLWGGVPLRWTADGRWILFRTYDASGDWRIMRIPAGGGAVEFDGVSYLNLSPLAPDIRMVRGNFISLDVSPDGSRLVVSTLTAPKFEVWAIDRLAP